MFFPVVTLLYFLLPQRLRWVHLLIASCIFYMYFIPVYILILFLTIFIDYFAGILIEQAGDKAARKRWLILSIVANVGVLCVFKYYNFFTGNINALLGAGHMGLSLPLLNIILPIGLSFHTFQAMSYTIEIYRGNQQAERHLGIYALYVMFYPQLVAGPIERPQNLLHQFREKHEPEYDKIVSGLRLMLWGMIKKVVIADRIELITGPVFNHPQGNTGTMLWLAVALFHIQVFCDFSGYSDIAIGAARVMGFKLMTNFNMPFHARTVSDFWRRWHISLSTWFRDYVYMPLGGNKQGRFKIYRNLFIVCLLSGLWHGASWLFVLWGLLQGGYMIFAHLTKDARKRLNAALGITRVKWLDHGLDIIITFSLTAFARVFFRGRNLDDAAYFIKKLPAVPHEIWAYVVTGRWRALGLPRDTEVLWTCIVFIAMMEVAHLLKLRYDLEQTFATRPVAIRWSLYFTGVILLVFWGVYTRQQFIYFQF